jgi:hypothetical protein
MTSGDRRHERSITVALVIGLLASFVVAANAAGHFGAAAYIIVPADHVLPGQPFEVIGADLTPNSTVSFAMLREGETTALDDSASGPDGHFNATLTLPASFPVGYAQLFATATDGTSTSTWVLVGARSSSTPPAPGTPAVWADPSVLLLVVLVIGAVGLVGLMLLRRRTSVVQPRSQRRRR